MQSSAIANESPGSPGLMLMAKQCAWCGAIRHADHDYIDRGMSLVAEIQVTMIDGEIRHYPVSHGICAACRANVVGR